MQWRHRSIEELADMVCGNYDQNAPFFFPYRASSALTRFFRDADTDFRHDGSTRAAWVASALTEILNEPQPDAKTPPDAFLRVLTRLMDLGDRTVHDTEKRENALRVINVPLGREGYEAFYADDGKCYLRHVGTQSVIASAANPHRPFSRQEEEKRAQLAAYLDKASEDEFIGEVLLPMLRQVGFHRITSGGHTAATQGNLQRPQANR